MMDNAADEEAVQKQEEQEKLEILQRKEDIRAILNQPSGIRFFRWLFAEAGFFKSSFTGNSQTFFLEGRRDLALKLYDEMLDASPVKAAEVLVDMREAKRKEKEIRNA